MVINIILFCVGLLVLIKGGDWFVDGSTGIARKFRLPEILIGATVVSIGTTLPEVMVSAQGALAGSGDMAYGNAMGSIICNTSLIAALTIAIKPSKADRKSLILPVCFFFGAAALYAFVAYFFGRFYLWVGIVLLLAFVAYMIINIIKAKRSMTESKSDVEAISDAAEEASEEAPKEGKDFLGFILVGASMIIAQLIMTFGTGESSCLVGAVGAVVLAVGILKAFLGKKLKLLSSNVLVIILGAILIAIGADFLVDNGMAIAAAVGVPETVIALTFVALGTSLPELVTAITSLAKGHSALSLGNIIGANLFNLVLVNGVATTLSPFDVPTDSTLFGHPTSLVLDIPMMIAVMLLLTVPALIWGKLSRAQGIILLCLYAAFCVVQFVI